MSEPKLKQLPRYKRIFVAAWLKWEHLFAKWYHIQELPGEEVCMFRLSRRKYPGPDLELPDGRMLHHGAMTAEIHFNNEYLMLVNQIESETRLGITLIRGAQSSLARVARYIMSQPSFDDVHAVWGTTLLYRGAEKFGFSLREPYSRFTRLWLSIYLPILLRVFHPDGGHRLKRRAELLKPKMVYVSREAFLAHFQDADPNGHSKRGHNG